MHTLDMTINQDSRLGDVWLLVRVIVSYREKTAVVTYDDARADVKALTAATGNAGYPSAPKG
jgi:hypothetical protein